MAGSLRSPLIESCEDRYAGNKHGTPSANAERPFDDPRLEQACVDTANIVESIQDLKSLLDASGSSRSNWNVVFQSRAMLAAVTQAKRYANSSATVLLTGESGTGKELIARLIHEHSQRAAESYVRVNCAALSENLVESELFGHERGAFTGAVESRSGRFEWADGGTLLLDEISEIPLNIQAKLLRVLEDEEFQRVGSNKSYHVDVRFITTTNRSLEHEIKRGTFRADLFHRLNVLELHLPALRERPEDISILTTHFLARFKHEATVPIEGISKESMRFLLTYDWPGNVRQLRNVIHRACVLADSSMITPNDLPPLESAETTSLDAFDDMGLEEIERHVILARLRRFNGNKTAAATDLGVTARTLSNKMNRYRRQGYA